MNGLRAQTGVLAERYLLCLLGDWVSALLLLAQAPLIGWFCTLVWSDVQEDTPQLRFILCLSAVWFGCINACREIVKERAIVERERIFAHGFDTSAVLEREGLQLIDHMPRRFLLDEDGPRHQEVYDLALEGEIVDRLAERSDEGARLLELLHTWRAEHAREVVITVPGREAEDALRELGYLDD